MEQTEKVFAGGLISQMPEPNEYRPSNSELLREYEIGIRFTSRGCIVRVGCKDIPFESIENGMQAINDYINNPYEERKKWEEILK